MNVGAWVEVALHVEDGMTRRHSFQRCPQYCWEFHDPEPLLQKEASPAVLGGGNSGNALEASNALNYRAWGIPAVLSRGFQEKL